MANTLQQIVARMATPAIAEALDRGDFIKGWEERLAEVGRCATDAQTEEDVARHEGYQAALSQCILDMDRLLCKPVGEVTIPVPPAVWNCAGRWGPDGLRYVRRWKGQNWQVFISVAYLMDGRRWAHVSASRPDRCPTWEEMAEIKRDFLGDLAALQVAPPASQHVNLHETCLHWWAPLDVWPLPDFARGGLSI